MRIALLADIHGNLFALDAVLADIHQRNVEQILCLGDVASGGPQPCEAIQRLREIGCPIVMGNTDAWLLEPRMRERESEFARRNQEIEFWSSQQLSEEDKAFLRTFQPTITQQINGTKTLLAYHGSPRSFREAILPTTPDAELDAIFGGLSGEILVGGHTHLQMFRRYREKLVLNPGSIGMAMDRTFPFEEVHNPPWAEYAILNIDGNSLDVEFHRIPFDLDGWLRVHFTCGMPHAEWSANLWNRI